MYQHDFANHGSSQYVQDDVYTHTIEGFWVGLKRGVLGIYHSWSKKYPQDYVLETLVDVAESKEEFKSFFEKKYRLHFPDLNDCIYQKKKELSDFDKKLWIAMYYNPRGDKGGK